MDSFGVLFGRLVREKRGIEGLSQDSLGTRSGLTKARISDIERGKIANPQTKTVDALCVALNLSREERAACHTRATSLPRHLLERLARHFGSETPDATESELEAFLFAKAEEFHALQDRLSQLALTEEKLSNLLEGAKDALGEGEFERADDLLSQAEAVHLQSTTIVALRMQSDLRIHRGNAALLRADVDVASEHFERSSQYFSGVDTQRQASVRYECATLLRYFAYRYMDSRALLHARLALERNLSIWNDMQSENWCEAKIALGGISWRLSQFDGKRSAMSHLADAKGHYEDVLAQCSEERMPLLRARTKVSLANVYTDRRLSKSPRDYKENLQRGLGLQLTALASLSEVSDPEAWGILQHNLGCTYIALSEIRTDGDSSIVDLRHAISHAKLSFNVRDPEDSLQYWVASCRTLGEGLLRMAGFVKKSEVATWVDQASKVLRAASSKISREEHPNQWDQIQEQIDKL